MSAHDCEDMDGNTGGFDQRMLGSNKSHAKSIEKNIHRTRKGRKKGKKKKMMIMFCRTIPSTRPTMVRRR